MGVGHEGGHPEATAHLEQVLDVALCAPAVARGRRDAGRVQGSARVSAQAVEADGATFRGTLSQSIRAFVSRASQDWCPTDAILLPL